MSDDKPDVSTTDPDDWRTFVVPDGPAPAANKPPRPKLTGTGELITGWHPPSTWIDETDPAGLTAAQEIRLRLAEAILAADGIPLVDSQADFVNRLAAVVTGVAAVVERGKPVGAWYEWRGEHGPELKVDPDCGNEYRVDGELVNRCNLEPGHDGDHEQHPLGKRSRRPWHWPQDANGDGTEATG